MRRTHRRTALGLVPVSVALLALLLSAAPANASGEDDSSSGSGSHSSNGGHGSDDAAGDDHGRGHGSDDAAGDDHGANSGADSASDVNDDNGGDRHGSDDNRGPSANSGPGTAATPTTTVHRRHGKARVIARQQCDAIATKLKVKPEDGGTEVEYELDQNVNGVSWALSLTRNGSSVATATRTTQPPSGSFEWRVVASNPAGADAYTVTAVNGSTTCTIAATL